MGRTVSILPAASPPVVIYDEVNPRPGAGAIPSRAGDFCRDGFLPKPARLFQKTDVMRGAAPFVVDRFNMNCVWNFTVLHAFAGNGAGQQACQDFIGNRPAIIRTGGIAITTLYAGVNYRRVYAVGWLQKCEPVRDRGVSCEFEYTLWLPSLYSIT